MLNLGKLAKTMDISSKDCLREGKKKISLFFPKFLILKRELTSGKPIYHGQTLHQSDVDDEAGCFENNEDVYNKETELEDSDAVEIISTDIFGKLHFWSADTLLLNGDRSTLSTKARLSRFKGDAFWWIFWCPIIQPA